MLMLMLRLCEYALIRTANFTFKLRACLHLAGLVHLKLMLV